MFKLRLCAFPPADYVMKLAAQKYIELKSEHFGKHSMSLFGGEFIRRLLKALESATLAPIAEVDEDGVDEAACADRRFVIDGVEAGTTALRSFVPPAESDAPTEAETRGAAGWGSDGGRGAGVQPCA